MAERVYLAVDLGAESGRVIAGLFDGGAIALGPVHRFDNRPVALAGSLRWDVLRLWTEIQEGLVLAAKSYGDAVASVGVDTWGVDYVLMTVENELLGQPFHYRDARTDGLLNHALTRVPREQIFAATGLQFMEINTLYQLLAMQARSPELLRLADAFLMMPDFFHWCLCGSRVVEFTNATTTQCFHPVDREWSFDLLRRFELPRDMFPPVVDPGTKLGALREEVAYRTGLKRIEVIAPATHDTASAVAAVPTENTGRADWAYISSGTWSLMGAEVREPVLSGAALRRNFTNEGGVDGTYRLLKNIMGLWLVQECRRSFVRSGKPLDYDALTQLAQDAPPFRSLVDPDDATFLAPDDMPAAIAAWCSDREKPAPETEGQFVRCALESLSLKYRMVLGWLEELTGVRVEVIHIVGGGTRNALLNQFTANACGRLVIAGPVEATALGNLLVQARSAGDVGSLAEIRDVVRASSQLQRFEPQDPAAWDDAYGRFRELLDVGSIR
ncbi:MAG: rhamnulokinase family protein [Planctomycetaceae bacterium]